MEILVPNLLFGYADVVNAVVKHGRHKAPRGLPTLDVPSATIIVSDPSRCLPIGTGRNISSRLAAVEALGLIGGFCDPNLLVRASADMAKYMDGGNFWGGYGQRARAQMPMIVERLVADPDTRQAQVVLWDPALDALVTDARDYPCTTSLQFFVTDGKLELHVHMRSNDVWRGFSLDAFVFTQLQLAVAGFLGYDVGPYYHHASSLHIYESDIDSVKNLRTPDADWQLLGLLRTASMADPAKQWRRATKTIRDHVRVADVDDVDVYTGDFHTIPLQWYVEKMTQLA